MMRPPGIAAPAVLELVTGYIRAVTVYRGRHSIERRRRVMAALASARAEPRIPAFGAAPEAGKQKRDTRQRPTLPPRCQGSTIGAGGLNCCVRDGNRCFPTAMITGYLSH